MQVHPHPALAPLHVDTLLKHFQAMMGPFGLYQHATYFTPLLSEGYCTDDNARAVTTLLYLRPLVPAAEQPLIETLLSTCWTFVVEAQETAGRFYNFRNIDGDWLPMGRSEDMYTRIMRAAVSVMTLDTDTTRIAQARLLLSALIGSGQLESFISPRAWAEILVNISLLSKADFTEWQGAVLIDKGFQFFKDLWAKNASAEWPWFEPIMTYANALLPHGLLLALQLKPDAEIEKMMRESADFLVKTTVKDEVFMPIGNAGWYLKGGKAAIEHQQPIEASLMFDFLLDYYHAYPSLITPDQLSAPYLWFFGLNLAHIVLADEDLGACRDGLFIDGVNENRGAESMLAYVWTEIRARQSSRLVQEAIMSGRTEQKQ